jgi:hypothetical protein
MTTSAPTIVATSAEEGLKSCGSAPTGITVVAVPPAQVLISSARLPSTVVVATTVGGPELGSVDPPPHAVTARAIPAQAATVAARR